MTCHGYQTDAHHCRPRRRPRHIGFRASGRFDQSNASPVRRSPGGRSPALPADGSTLISTGAWSIAGGCTYRSAWSLDHETLSKPGPSPCRSRRSGRSPQKRLPRKRVSIRPDAITSISRRMSSLPPGQRGANGAIAEAARNPSSGIFRLCEYTPKRESVPPGRSTRKEPSNVSWRPSASMETSGRRRPAQPAAALFRQTEECDDLSLRRLGSRYRHRDEAAAFRGFDSEEQVSFPLLRLSSSAFFDVVRGLGPDWPATSAITVATLETSCGLAARIDLRDDDPLAAARGGVGSGARVRPSLPSSLSPVGPAAAVGFVGSLPTVTATSCLLPSRQTSRLAVAPGTQRRDGSGQFAGVTH